MSNRLPFAVTVPNLCPCLGQTLDKLIRPAILTVLARQAAHGYKIAQQIANIPMLRGRKPDPTGVYRLLKSMEDKGLVTSTWNISQAGPAKRLYKLTAAGKECLHHWIETLEVYQQSIGKLLLAARKVFSQEMMDNTEFIKKRKTDRRLNGKMLAGQKGRIT